VVDVGDGADDLLIAAFRSLPQSLARRVDQPVGERCGEELEHLVRAPAGGDPDFFPITVLDSVLAGASSLNLFGGGLSNKTSRLYRALVEKELAASISGSLSATIDPYLYVLRATVRPDRTPEAVLQALDGEIQRVLDSPLESAEVAKAIKQARALFAYGSESITNQAFWLGYSEMFADYDWFEGYVERLAAVTPEDILRAARKVLAPTNRVVGIYRPNGGGARG